LLSLPPLGFQESGRPVSSEAEICCGPRQLGQSSGSIAASSCAAAGRAAMTINPVAKAANQATPAYRRPQGRRELIKKEIM
jgi:hypothetical protein